MPDGVADFDDDKAKAKEKDGYAQSNDHRVTTE